MVQNYTSIIMFYNRDYYELDSILINSDIFIKFDLITDDNEVGYKNEYGFIISILSEVSDEE